MRAKTRKSRLVRLGNSIGKRIFRQRHFEEAFAEISELREKLPTLEMQIALPYLYRGKGFFQEGLDFLQNLKEFLPFAEFLKNRALRTICEIGTFRGGTLYVWCQLAAPDALLISVDLPGGHFGPASEKRSIELFKTFGRSEQIMHFVRGDSKSASTVEEVQRCLGGRRIDFLFIDGDHSYDGVKQDYLNYAPFVRQGGVIGFHDILQRNDRPNSGVWKFWQEIKEKNPDALEFTDLDSRPHLGIGVIVKN